MADIDKKIPRYTDIALSEKTDWENFKRMWNNNNYSGCLELSGTSDTNRLNANVLNTVIKSMRELELYIKENAPIFKKDKIKVSDSPPESMSSGEIYFKEPYLVEAGSFAIGDTIYLSEMNTTSSSNKYKDIPYIVIQQGIPAGGNQKYDNNMNSKTWLMRQNVDDVFYWTSKSGTSLSDQNYGGSDLSLYLDGGFFQRFGETEQHLIRSSVVPVYEVDSDSVQRMETKVFLLSAKELNFGAASFEELGYVLPDEGVPLDYFKYDFSTGTPSILSKEDQMKRRKAHLSSNDGAFQMQWTRTPYRNTSTVVNNKESFVVTKNGWFDVNPIYKTSTPYPYVRPVVCISRDTMVNYDTKKIIE